MSSFVTSPWVTAVSMRTKILALRSSSANFCAITRAMRAFIRTVLSIKIKAGGASKVLFDFPRLQRAQEGKQLFKVAKLKSAGGYRSRRFFVCLLRSSRHRSELGGRFERLGKVRALRTTRICQTKRSKAQTARDLKMFCGLSSWASLKCTPTCTFFRCKQRLSTISRCYGVFWRKGVLSTALIL